MALARPIEPITATDDELRAALEVADLPALLPALAHVTGDLSLLRDGAAHRPAADGRGPGWPHARAAGGDPRPRPARRWSRSATAAASSAPMPTGPDLRRILEFMAGGLEIDEYLPMMREELALTADLRAPRWHKDDVNPDKPFQVVIIGAGMSGIVAAYRLAEADVPYIVVDKNADVGGTWLENSYPGCRVDIPNHYYSYSFAQRDDWPLYYSPRSELHKYFRECVDEFGIRPNIRFNTEVSSVVYDEDTATWNVAGRRRRRPRVARSRPTP